MYRYELVEFYWRFRQDILFGLINLILNVPSGSAVLSSTSSVAPCPSTMEVLPLFSGTFELGLYVPKIIAFRAKTITSTHPYYRKQSHVNHTRTFS